MRTLCSLFFICSLANAADWPQWMGPNRDGVWSETGILDKFPDGGPKKLWSREIAGGYSGPAVANGRVFVMDYVRKGGDPKPDAIRKNELSGDERVLCFESATGKPLWTHKYDCPYAVSYPAGPRCTTTVHDGKVYALGTMGHLTCLNAETGKPVWEHNLPKEFNAKVPHWGYAGHPLVYKKLLICLVGGAEALLVAFDKDTGERKWNALSTSGDDGPGYCPPSLIEAGGTAQLLLWHPQGVVSVNPDNGEVYWKEQLKPSYGMSIMMPRRAGDLLYAAGMGGAAVTLKLEAKKPAVSVVWRGGKNTAVYPANSTPIIDGDVIYGVDVSGHLRAVKLSTGERLWETTDPTVEAPNVTTPHGTAFLVKNGDRYFLFNEKGSLIIANLSPDKYTEISKAKLLDPTTLAFNRTVVWSHPAFAEKCVFVRNDKEIACFSLAK